MQFKNLEHIGIAVKDLDKAKKLFENLFHTAPYKDEIVKSEGVVTTFFKVGDIKIELLSGIQSNNPIDKFIHKKGEGIHHIAFEVDDIVKESDRLKEKGFILINDQPKSGADNKLINFIHPKSTGGILIEICQEKK